MTTGNLEVLAYEESPIGMICLRRRELLASPGTIITEITLDHELLMSSYHTDSERALSTLALDRHSGDDLRVLVGGLGLGYTAHEVLASSRTGHVTVVEFLSQVIDWMRDGLFPLATSLNAEDRLEIAHDDVYARLALDPRETFDLILIDVDHSPDERLGESNASFYSEPGLALAKRHLAKGGLLGVWSYAESSPFADALRASFDHVEVEEVSFDNHLTQEHETNWLFFARDD
jgi:spermidine synthase